MLVRNIFFVVCAISIGGLPSTAFALGYNSDERCLDSPGPVYSNVQFDVMDFTNPETPLTVKAVLTQPVRWVRTKRHSGCFMLIENPPAIVMLHGSGGMDTRNAFYAQKLQSRFATLSVEMFEGSISGGTGRPELPLFNYSHAFGALKFLVEVEGVISENGTVVAEDDAGSVRKVKVDPDAVGCLGLSWGGVICNQVATELYSQQFGDELYGTDYRFAAHVANYPVCYGRNVVPFPGLQFGSAFGAELTGAPVLIQVGSLDAYDNAEGQSGSETCNMLKDSLLPDEQELVDVVVFEGGYHAFDRLFAVTGVVRDPFARLGVAIGDPNPENWPEVAIIPDQAIANKSLRNILRFFHRNLRAKGSN
jgi:dienelactone hydrolase